MKKHRSIYLTVLLFLTGISFINWFGLDKPEPIPASRQRKGNAARGYEYLVNGDYVKGGIPYDLFMMGAAQQPRLLKREGRSAALPHDYTAVQAKNGEILVAPNCLQCHAQVFDGQLIIGLGNSLSDFTVSKQVGAATSMMEKMLQLRSPQQYEAAANFIRVTKTISPYLTPAVQGVNVADRLAAVLVAHRDPISLQWNETPSMDIPAQVIPTDTPPWWLLKKKNAMFYNGFGRGDFGRFLMASNLLTVNDTSESRTVDEHMPDLLSYIYSLQAPAYPKPIDQGLALQGKKIFERNCSGCHGTYGKNGQYPNLLIPQSIIQTDSLLYTSNYSNPQFVNWFNRSWFTMGDHPAQLVPYRGYIAPPLDGIWVSAPYLHNGSVPDLEGVLNSSKRPRYWSRDFVKPQYKYGIPGWEFKVREQPGDKTVYNTDLPGYGNYGHYFGDELKDAERKAVIEYLKTL